MTPTRRTEPVTAAGQTIGRTVRINVAEVEAIVHQPDRPWDTAAGIYRRRNQGRAAVMGPTPKTRA